MLTLIKSMIEFLFSQENQLIFQLQHLATNNFDELRTRSLKNDTNEWYAHFSEKHVAQLCCLEHKNNGDNWTCRCNRNVNFYFNSSTNLHIQIAKLLWPIDKQLTKPSQVLWPVDKQLTKPSQVLWPIDKQLTKPSQALWPIDKQLTKPSQVLWPIDKQLTKPSQIYTFNLKMTLKCLF